MEGSVQLVDLRHSRIDAVASLDIEVLHHEEVVSLLHPPKQFFHRSWRQGVTGSRERERRLRILDLDGELGRYWELEAAVQSCRLKDVIKSVKS